MEENVLMRHQLIPSSTATAAGGGGGDVNFSDVFGGPPRRSRQGYSFADSDHGEEDDEGSETLPYRGVGEKPVFGEGSSNQRRRRRGNDFFSDIFRSDESSSSTTPGKQQDAFGSAPGSRVLSPVRPKPDPFGGSVPSPFSLSPKLPKPMDLPTFGSPPRSSRRSKDQASEGINSSPSSRATLSRFSSQSIQDQESKNDIQSFYRQSSSSLNTEELLPSAVQLKNAGDSSEVWGDGLQFHFSIYKWASKGAPMVMPLRSSRTKQMAKTEVPSSLSMEGELTPATPHGTDKPSFVVKKDDDLLLSTSTHESSQMVEELSISLPEPATAEDVPCDTILSKTVEKTKPNSHSRVGLGGKPDKATPAPVQETLKINDLSPPPSLLNDSIELDNDNKSVKSGRNKSNEKAFVEKNKAGKKVVKKLEEKQNALTDTEADKAGIEGSPKKPGKSLARNGVKGKMKELVKIFNHEVSSKTKTAVDPKTQSQSCRWNGTFRPENEASRDVVDKDQKLQPHPNKKVTSKEANVIELKEATLKEATIIELKSVTPSEVEEYLKQSEKRYSATKTDKYVPSDTSQPEYTSVSSTASVPDVSKTVVGDTDDSFHQDFVIEELPLEKNDKPLPDKDREDKQVIDTKIRKWLSGKEGNIRSMLSTLQYVLWPESGWKPVPLVNIIEGNAVKRAYQRALLSLHPDKLQQKGASSDQKYIAEKVFDILQEAWTQFNALGSL